MGVNRAAIPLQCEFDLLDFLLFRNSRYYEEYPKSVVGKSTIISQM
jgi:hypothetical protein